MTIARSAADVLRDHVVLEYEAIDRMYRAPCKARFLSGRQSHPAWVAPAGSNRSDEGGDEIVEAYDAKGHLSDPASLQAVMIER